MGKAKRLFNGDAEQTLYKRVTPSQEQRDFLQTQWNALADHLRAQLFRNGYPVSTWIQGSYKYGTLIKPVRYGEEYDVDLGVYFEWEAGGVELEPTPGQLRDWVQRELVIYKGLNSDVKEITEPKERCSRAIYSKRFHIDTPTYHLDPRRDRRRLATLSGEWEVSDPKAFYKWFKAALNGAERDQVRRLIRYLKGWAALAFENAPDARPSSIFLTVLTTRIYEGAWFDRLSELDDDDALILVIKKMHERLVDDRDVCNPIDSQEQLNRISKEAWPSFLTRLTALRDCAEDAEAAQDEPAAAMAWTEAFSFLMPLPEGDEIEVAESETSTALMQIPDVKIEVATDADFKDVLADHINEVPSVARKRWLRFTILNSAIVPNMAHIEWTVRNDGTEAEFLGDLGHASGGIGAFSVTETTAYAGKQYMDLVIRCNGTVYAARRIAVYIDGNLTTQGPKATTRAWMKLRSRRTSRR